MNLTKDDILSAHDIEAKVEPFWENAKWNEEPVFVKKKQFVETSKVANELEQIRLELVNGYDGYALGRVVKLIQTLRAKEEKR
jgi:hypothetical protein